MKAVEFGKVAATAEAQRLQRVGLRYAKRVAFLVVAGLFGLFALISAHVTLWMIFYGPFGISKVWSSVIVLGLDLLVAGVFLLLGRSNQPGPGEIKARMVRDRNLEAMKSALAFGAVSATVFGPPGRMAGRGILDLIRGRFSRRRPPVRARSRW